jgi:membrane peptidoglycan carboxypeptidase
MVDRSLGRAFVDPGANATTVEGVDGLPREPSFPLTLEERLRRWGRGASRAIGATRLGRLRRWQAMLLFISIFCASGALSVYYGPATLTATPPLQTAFLFDREGKPLGQIRAEENRVVVPLSKIPKVVQQAFIATEDSRFYSHPGVDPLAIVRAIFANAKGDREGASTITQQLVKNSTVGGKRTLWTKFNEAVTAIRLDRRYTKEKILGSYLNSIYLGHGAYGVEAASLTYFGHGIKDATLPEAALLAGITAAPQLFSPRTNKKGALERRNIALDRMYENGFISRAEHDAAVQVPIKTVRPPKRIPAVSPLFVDWVRGEMLRRFGEDVLYRGGLRVTTSLDLDVQRAAEEAVADVFDRSGDPSAAVVAIDVSSGEVRAMVGGRSPKPGDFNLATRARRQAGSAFKPFVLAAALDDGFKLSKSYRAPGSIRLRFDSGEVWKVANFDRSGYGWQSLRSATAHSVNTVFAQLIRDVGPDRVVEMAHSLGITSHLSAVPSLALGTSGVTALEMASAYATFANDGDLVRPTGLSFAKNGDGDLVFANEERRGNRVIPSSVADDVTEALRGVVSRGTGYTVRIKGVNDIAGKTGTTEDHRDAWFVGYSHGFAIAVWAGYPSNKPMNNVHGIKVTGNSFPAQIFKRVLTALLDKYQRKDEPTKTYKGSKAGLPTAIPSASPSSEPSEEPTDEPTPGVPPRRCTLIINCR